MKPINKLPDGRYETRTMGIRDMVLKINELIVHSNKQDERIEKLQETKETRTEMLGVSGEGRCYNCNGVYGECGCKKENKGGGGGFGLNYEDIDGIKPTGSCMGHGTITIEKPSQQEKLQKLLDKAIENEWRIGSETDIAKRATVYCDINRVKYASCDSDEITISKRIDEIENNSPIKVSLETLLFGNDLSFLKTFVEEIEYESGKLAYVVGDKIECGDKKGCAHAIASHILMTENDGWIDCLYDVVFSQS